MAEPTLLSDIIQPAWQSLTPEQRTCWHFWAATHPEVDELGRLVTLYGQQAHYARNADIATLEGPALLAEPPTVDAAPSPVLILTFAWPLQARLEGTTTLRNGFAYAELDQPLPSDTAVIVRQGYDQKKTGRGRPPRIRHVTVLVPLSSGNINLTLPTGYYATTAGNNRYATIKGVTAQRKPDKPLGTARIVNVTTGKTIRQILSNPYGGAPRQTNRARATQVSPLSGVNHYP